jgi:hypothetical protein
MPQELPWIIALASLALLACGCWLWLVRRRTHGTADAAAHRMDADRAAGVQHRRTPRLPPAARGAAAPHRAVEAAAGALLPAHRSAEVRYWYELLGAIHITFAICSANGRVLAAIDLDTDRGNSRRVLQIKQSVLAACRVRYLRCPVDHLPSIPELQLLVPQSSAARGPQPPDAQPRDSLPAPWPRARASAARCGRTRASSRTPSSARKPLPTTACQRVRRPRQRPAQRCAVREAGADRRWTRRRHRRQSARRPAPRTDPH